MEKFIVPPNNRGKAQSRGVCLGITLLRHSKINPIEPAWENTNRDRKAHLLRANQKPAMVVTVFIRRAPIAGECRFHWNRYFSLEG